MDQKSSTTFRIAHSSLADKLRWLYGNRFSRFGDAELDERYLCWSVKPGAARRMNLKVLKTILRRLETLSASGAPTLEVLTQKVNIVIPRDLSSDPQSVLEALRWGRRFADELAWETAAPGPKVSAQLSRAGDRCPVCRDSMVGQRRDCGDCRASYHPECWEGLGGCATLGCRRMYRRAERVHL